MNEQAGDDEPSVGAVYGAIGIGLTAGGAYAVIAGAVARGIQLARR